MMTVLMNDTRRLPSHQQGHQTVFLEFKDALTPPSAYLETPPTQIPL